MVQYRKLGSVDRKVLKQDSPMLAPMLGMKNFIEKIHALGFKFGLYTDIGEKACHHPFTGSFPYYQQDANTFADWGVDYVKFDGCDLPAGYTPEQLTCNMSDALANTGKDIWLNFHCWHQESCATCGNSFRKSSQVCVVCAMRNRLVIGVSQHWRHGGSVVFSELYDTYCLFNDELCTVLISTTVPGLGVGPDHHDEWSSTSGIIDLLRDKRMPFWGPNPTDGWPDPDFVFTGGEGCGQHSAPGQRCPGQTDDE